MPASIYENSKNHSYFILKIEYVFMNLMQTTYESTVRL
jgi:hypothetical protein